MSLRFLLNLAVVLTLLLPSSSLSIPSSTSPAERKPSALPTSTVSGASHLGLVGRSGGATNAIFADGTHAYLGQGTQLMIFDLVDPAQPAHMAAVDLNYPVQGVTVADGYAYVVGPSGLAIINVGNPEAPFIASLYPMTGTISTLAVKGGYAYIPWRGSWIYGGVRVVNVADPLTPNLVSNYVLPGAPYDISLAGHYAYVASESGLRVLDLTNPAALTEASSYLFTTTAVVTAGNYAYILKTENLEGTYTGTLCILDITQPTNPTAIGEYTLPAYSLGSFGIKDMEVGGQWAYLADDRDRLLVVDVSTPTAPALTTSQFFGWPTARLALAGHYAYAAAGNAGGMGVVDLSNPSQPVMNAKASALGYASNVVASASYAYVVESSGSISASLLSVNASNALNPTLGGRVRIDEIRDMTLAGNFAYLAVGGGLAVVDVSNPMTPTLASSFQAQGVSPHTIVVSGTYAYLTGWSSDFFKIVDFSNLTTPTLVGWYNPFPGDAGYPEVAAVSGHYAYVGWVYSPCIRSLCNTSAGLKVIDVANPAAPIGVGGYPLPRPDEYIGLFDVVTAGHYLFVAENQSDSNPGGVRILDISNPTAPVQVGFYDDPGQARAVQVVNDLVYIADGNAGLRVVDVSNPAAPAEVAAYSAPPGVGFVDVAVANGTIYVATGANGLLILRQGFSVAGQVLLPNGAPRPGVAVALQPGVSAISDLHGNYAFPTLPPATYSLTPTLPGFTFLPSQRGVNLTADTSAQNFVLVPRPMNALLTPGVATTLVITDAQGLPLQLDFPSDAVTQTTPLTVTPTVVPDLPGLRFAGHAFTLAVSESSVFSAPVTVTVRYSEGDVATISDETQLAWRWWTGSAWQDAAEGCPTDGAYHRDVTNKELATVVCRKGLYALFGPTYQVLFPLVNSATVGFR